MPHLLQRRGFLRSSGYRFFDEERRAGTLAPFSRASLRPMAIACLRLFTVRPDPLFRLPFFRRRIADATRFEAERPYFAIMHLACSEVHGAFQQINDGPETEDRGLNLARHLDHRAAEAQAIEEPLGAAVLLRGPQHDARCAALAQPFNRGLHQQSRYA